MEKHQKKPFKQILTEALEKTKNVLKRLSKPLKSIGFIVMGFTLATISPCARSPDVTDAKATSLNADLFAVVPSARISLGINGTSYVNVEVPTMFIQLSEGIIEGYFTPMESIRLIRPPFPDAPDDYWSVSMPRTGQIGGFNFLSSTDYDSYFYHPDTSNDYNKMLTLFPTLYVFEAPIGIISPTLYPDHVEFNMSNSGFYVDDNYEIQKDSRGVSLVWSFMNGNTVIYRFSINWRDTYVTYITTDYFEFAYVTLNPEYLPTTQTAYDMGYAEGFYRGKLSVTPDSTPFDALVDSVNGLLSIEILPNVPLRIIFYVGFGLVLFGFLIKIFLGG